MKISRNVSRPLSTEDKISLSVLILFVIIVGFLMRMDTADWAFRKGHYFLPVNEELPQPILDFDVKQVEPGTVRLSLQMANISLAEFCTSKDVGQAKGHVHILVDGRKYGSFYVTEAIVENLSPGSHTITVSLNKPPSHKGLTWKGEPIAKTKIITIEG